MKSRRIAALGLAAGLAALAPASAGASTLIVPGSPTPAPVLTPQAAPAAPAPSATAPSAASGADQGSYDPPTGVYDPTSASIRENLDPGAVATGDPGVRALDVGHGIDQTYGQNTGEVDAGSRGEAELEIQQAQEFIENIQAGSWWLLPPGMYSLARAAAVVEQTELIAQLTERLAQLDDDEYLAALSEPAAIHYELGYSGVSDQACGATGSLVNGEIEDPNSGVRLC